MGMIFDFLQICGDNVYVILHGNYKKGKIDLNTLGNPALLSILRNSGNPPVKGLPRLTKKQRACVKRFYSPYVRFMTLRYHRLYTAVSRRFSPAYLPEELFAFWIDRYYNDRAEARFLDNKCYYYRLFSDVKQPEPVAMRIGTTWLDGSLRRIPFDRIKELLAGEAEVVLKKAVNSEGALECFFCPSLLYIRIFCVSCGILTAMWFCSARCGSIRRWRS